MGSSTGSVYIHELQLCNIRLHSSLHLMGPTGGVVDINIIKV